MKLLRIGLLLVIFFITSLQLNLFAQESDSLKTVDPKIVLEKYLSAIGGRDALSKVEDRTTIMRGTAMGQSLTIIVKQKAPNKMRQEVKAGGMDQTIIFDGEKGVMKAATQNVDVTGKELEQLKTEASMELMLDPESFGIKLSYEGSEKINGKDAHKIKMTLPSGIRWFTYFDAESGLKIKEQKEQYRAYARATLRKDKRVNIRISEKDLLDLRKQAMRQGIPYQTLLSSILHKYANGILTEK